MVYPDITDPVVDACVGSGHAHGDDESCRCGYRTPGNPYFMTSDQACAAFGHPAGGEDENGVVYCHCGRVVSRTDRTEEN